MRLLILADAPSWDGRYQVSALAASAAAAGDRVDLALFAGALAAWVEEGGWDRLDPAPPIRPERLEELSLPPLSEMMEGARGSGALHLFACSASVRVLDLDPAAVQARVVMSCWLRS